MIYIQGKTITLHFITTHLPKSDGFRLLIISTVHIPTYSEVPLRKAQNKYAKTTNTEHEHPFPLGLDNTVAKSGFGVTNMWVGTGLVILVNNNPIFLPEGKEDNSKNADHGYPITLYLFTTKYVQHQSNPNNQQRLHPITFKKETGRSKHHVC